MTILEVYEKYKHLDKELSDTEWLPGEVLANIIVQLWQAIKVRALVEAATQQNTAHMTADQILPHK